MVTPGAEEAVRRPGPRQISRVLDTIAAYVPRFHDQPSVGIIAAETHDPFLVLCATLLSLRTREEVTRAVMRRLFALARTPAQLAALPLPELVAAIHAVHYAEAKARVLQHISRALIERHGGRVPDTLEGLLALKGVGRKTANLVLTLGFGKPGICVDTHVHRIFNRLGYASTRTPEATERALREKLPPRYWIPVNNWLVVFGRNQCTPVRPKCSTCPVAQDCARVGVRNPR